MAFQHDLSALMAPLDAERHQVAIETLRACRTLRELESLAGGEGWLMPATEPKRLKLVRHGSGTFLVVQYEDGWSTRLSMQSFGAR